MNKYRLPSFGRIGLLCIIVGYIPVGIKPAVANTTDTLKPNLFNNVNNSNKVSAKDPVEDKANFSPINQDKSHNFAVVKPTIEDRPNIPKTPLVDFSSSELDASAIAQDLLSGAVKDTAPDSQAQATSRAPASTVPPSLQNQEPLSYQTRSITHYKNPSPSPSLPISSPAPRISDRPQRLSGAVKEATLAGQQVRSRRNPLPKAQPAGTDELQGKSLPKNSPPASSTSPASPTPPPLPDETLQNSAPEQQDSMDQVTNVSQLRDVRPGDWAYEALRELVERYGCIAGYPDGTYRGNRAMTRYEFAAGLRACLNQIEKLIAASTANFASKEDLEKLRRLTQEFQGELATLGTRVDKLEGRVGFLEAHQFSVTTKLNGQAIIAAVGATGGTRYNRPTGGRGTDPNIILVDRLRLNLQTSFTGKDLLITGLQAYNFGGNPFGAGSVQGTLFPGQAFLSSGMSKLSFEPQFPAFDPKDLTRTGVSGNSINLYKLLYIFPVASKLTLFAGTAAEVSDAFPAITPFADDGQDAISRFAGYNPVVRVSGGTSGTGLASAAGFIWPISDKVDLRALYGSANANIAAKGPEAVPGTGISINALGAGVFSGSSVAAAQLTLKPFKTLDIGLNYAHSYHEINILGTGLTEFSSGVLAIGNGNPGVPVTVNSVGGTLTWRFAPKIALSTYGAAFFVNASSRSINASTTVTSWMVGLHFDDLLKKGNAAGLIFGQPLFRTSVGGQAQFKDDPTDRRTTPYHLEGYYRIRVTDNISITPGAFVLFNPEANSRNRTTTVGVLRTTFTF